MIAVILSWIIISLVFLAFGDMIILIWNKITARNDQLLLIDTFWLGLSFVGTLAMIISLILPLDISVLIGVIGVSVIYWGFSYNRLIGFFQQIKKASKNVSRESGVFIFLSFILICFLVFVLPTILGDYDLYHLQSMMWTERYEVISGLGNLHTRFGFNSSFLTLTTLFSYHPDYYISFYSLNSLCFLVFSTWLFSHIKKDSSIFFLIGILAVYFIFINSYRLFFATTSTDVLANILIAYILISIVINLQNQSRVLFLFLVPVFCITLKLSSVVVIFVSIYVLFFLLKKREYKVSVFLLFLSFLVITPWILRFILLTGYLIYPFPSIDIFNFDWKIPINMVQNEKDWITAWARIPSMNKDIVLKMTFLEWFPVWIRNQNLKDLFLYSFVLLSPLFFFIRGKEQKFLYKYMKIWLISFVGVLFCFVSAPDSRFFLGFVATTVSIPFLASGHIFAAKKHFNLLVLFFFAVCFIKLGYTELQRVRLLAPSNTTIYPVSPERGQCDEADKMYITDNIGNSITIYLRKAENAKLYCFPSTPYIVPGLELRGKHLQDGFKVVNGQKEKSNSLLIE